MSLRPRHFGKMLPSMPFRWTISVSEMDKARVLHRLAQTLPQLFPDFKQGDGMTAIPGPEFSSDYSGPDMQPVCDQLNSLLRGEISAAETYTMAIKKLSDSDRSRSADYQSLRDMQEDHGRACQALRSRIREMGGEASNSSGAWGAWAQTVQGTAGIFGDAAALKSLKEGEEHGLKDYQDALDEVDATSASMIQSEFIPAQQRHIRMLDSMINAASRT